MHLKSFFVVLLVLLSSCSKADVDLLMEKFLWRNRVIMIFTPENSNAEFSKQIDMLKENINGLKQRDCVVWQFVDNEYVKLNNKVMPNLGTPKFYEHYKVDKSKFTFVLIGKDGGEKLRADSAVTSEKLFNLIDAMPMRKQEMRRSK